MSQSNIRVCQVTFPSLRSSTSLGGGGGSDRSKVGPSTRFFLSFGGSRGSTGIESYDAPWASHELPLKARLVSNSLSLCLRLPSGRIPGMYHQACLLHRISKHLNKSFFEMSANTPESRTTQLKHTEVYQCNHILEANSEVKWRHP